jgi:dTDP-4-dehydrorhamnose reductase
MKILLIGKTGQLGGAILRGGGDHSIEAPARDVLDVERPETVRRELARVRPDWVVNTAAFHEVPRCETESGRAFAVNCIAVRDLAAACAEAGANLMTFSTDYVFDGEQRVPYREDDRPAPLQIYGLSKLAGELAARAVAPERTWIVRTCGLYGPGGSRSRGGNFVDARVRDAREGRSLQMSSEQIVAPTSAEDLSRSVLRLMEAPSAEPGIYHLTNEGQCSWYEFTRAIFEIAGIAGDVTPVDRGGRSGAMRRPRYSVLANTRARELGIRLPPWRDALERYLKP